MSEPKTQPDTRPWSERIRARVHGELPTMRFAQLIECFVHHHHAEHYAGSRISLGLMHDGPENVADVHHELAQAALEELNARFEDVAGESDKTSEEGEIIPGDPQDVAPGLAHDIMVEVLGMAPAIVEIIESIANRLTVAADAEPLNDAMQMAKQLFETAERLEDVVGKDHSMSESPVLHTELWYRGMKVRLDNASSEVEVRRLVVDIVGGETLYQNHCDELRDVVGAMPSDASLSHISNVLFHRSATDGDFYRWVGNRYINLRLKPRSWIKPAIEHGVYQRAVGELLSVLKRELPNLRGLALEHSLPCTEGLAAIDLAIEQVERLAMIEKDKSPAAEPLRDRFRKLDLLERLRATSDTSFARQCYIEIVGGEASHVAFLKELGDEVDAVRPAEVHAYIRRWQATASVLVYEWLAYNWLTRQGYAPPKATGKTAVMPGAAASPRAPEDIVNSIRKSDGVEMARAYWQELAGSSGAAAACAARVVNETPYGKLPSYVREVLCHDKEPTTKFYQWLADWWFAEFMVGRKKA